LKELKPKEPLMALLLTVLLPGLGHFYVGKKNLGIKYFCILVGLPLAIIFFVAHPLTRIPFVIGYGFLAIGLFLIGLSWFVLFDSYKSAKSFNRHRKLKTHSSLARKFLLVIFIILLMFVFNPGSLVIRHTLQAFKIPTITMKPTLIEGDRVLVNKVIYKTSEPQRGDIIVFKYPNDPQLAFIKRLAGMPGENLEIKNGQLVINGKTIQSFTPNGGYFNTGDYGQEGLVVKIPQDKYFVLGDNTLNSRDSRYWGFVPKENLIGKAYKIYFPFDRSGPIE